MNSSVAVLGVDIAKLKFDVCLIKENGKTKHQVFANTRHGVEQLICWLNSHHIENLRVCLEVTGSYGESLAIYLFDAGVILHTLRPINRLTLNIENCDNNCRIVVNQIKQSVWKPPN